MDTKVKSPKKRVLTNANISTLNDSCGIVTNSVKTLITLKIYIFNDSSRHGPPCLLQDEKSDSSFSEHLCH